MKLYSMVTTEASKEYTEEALQTFFLHTPLNTFDEFLLIDNDNSYSLTSTWKERINFTQHQTPRSFAQNANFAIRQAYEKEADLFLLNNDILFPPNWILSLLPIKNEILSPLSNREMQLHSQDLKLKVAMNRNDLTGKHETLFKMIEQYTRSTQGRLKVFAVPFFCTYLPYSVLQDVGLFDESFGQAGAEDYDYCLRAILAGHQISYCLQSYVLHYGGRSTYAIEEREKQLHRERTFSKRFREKWGDALTRLILQEEVSVIEELKLGQFVQEGKYRLTLEKLLEPTFAEDVFIDPSSRT